MWSVTEMTFGKWLREQPSNFETDLGSEFIESTNDGAVELVESCGFIVGNESVRFEGFQDAAGEGCIKFFEQLQVDNTDAVTGRG